MAQAKSGAVDKATYSKLAETFDSGVRALANLQQWRSLGTLGQRISGMFSQFFGGTMSDSQRLEFAKLVPQFKKDLTKRLNKKKIETWGLASDLGMDPTIPLQEDRYQTKLIDGTLYEVDTFEQRIIRETPQ